MGNSNNKIPASWFDNDPEWEMLRHKADNRPVSKSLKQQVADQRPRIATRREQPRAQATREDSDKEVIVHFKVALPRVKLPNPKHLYKTHRKALFVVVGGVVCLVLAAGALQLALIKRSWLSGEVAGPASAEEQAKAAFNPLIPLENLKDAMGKQSEPEYSYDKDKKVLGYTAEYNGAVVTVSQQGLPEKLKTSPGELAYVAQSIRATELVETQKGTAYIATEEKSGAQTAVFATKEAMVFIRTNKKLDREEWKFYINQLNPSR